MAERSPPGGIHLHRALVLAAALAVTLELALYRVAVPVLSHIPGADLGRPGRALEALADHSFQASEVLVIAGATAFAAHALRTRPVLAFALVAALASVAVATLQPGGAISLAARVALVAAVVAVAAHAWTALPPARAVAHGAAALAVVAGQWPLVLQDAAATSGLGAAVATTGGELALVLTPVLFALAALRERSPSRRAWAAAAAGGLLAAAMLARSPTYTAILSTWAVGATLSLPPFLYIVAAGCAALLAVQWLGDSRTRPLAAGMVLLAAAALQPAVVHHNLTAVLALVLLATPALPASSPLADADPMSSIPRDHHAARAARPALAVGAPREGGVAGMRGQP